MEKLKAEFEPLKQSLELLELGNSRYDTFKTKEEHPARIENHLILLIDLNAPESLSQMLEMELTLRAHVEKFGEVRYEPYNGHHVGIYTAVLSAMTAMTAILRLERFEPLLASALENKYPSTSDGVPSRNRQVGPGKVQSSGYYEVDIIHDKRRQFHEYLSLYLTPIWPTR
jgi:hypothetical protein